MDFFANEPSKFIQLSYLGPDTGGEEWMVMPVAVLQHEPRLTSTLDSSRRRSFKKNLAGTEFSLEGLRIDQQAFGGEMTMAEW